MKNKIKIFLGLCIALFGYASFAHAQMYTIPNSPLPSGTVSNDFVIHGSGECPGGCYNGYFFDGSGNVFNSYNHSGWGADITVHCGNGAGNYPATCIFNGNNISFPDGMYTFLFIWNSSNGNLGSQSSNCTTLAACEAFIGGGNSGELPFQVGGAGSATSTLTISWPSGGSTPLLDNGYIQKDFTNWVIGFDNNSFNGQVLSIGVQYDDQTSTISNMKFSDFTTNFSPFVNIPPVGVKKGLNLQPPLFSLENLTGKSWFAVPFWEDASGTIFYGTGIKFLIGNTISPFCLIGCVNYNTSSSLRAGPFAGTSGYISPSSTTSFTLPNGSSATTTSQFSCGLYDWAGCLYNAGIATISYVQGIPATISNGVLPAIVSSTQRVWPIVIYADLNNDLALAKASSTGKGDLSLVGTNSGVNSGKKIFGGKTFVILNASTTSWIKDKAGFDYKTIIDYIFYAVTGLLLLAIAYATFKIMHNTQQ